MDAGLIDLVLRPHRAEHPERRVEHLLDPEFARLDVGGARQVEHPHHQQARDHHQADLRAAEQVEQVA